MITIVNLRALLNLIGCTVKTQKNSGTSNDVDICTPLGSMRLRGQGVAGNMGLALYPGARLLPDAKEYGGDNNVDMSIFNPLFSLKVVAQKYESDDPPGKILDFYEKQLRLFGSVDRCRNSKSAGFRPSAEDGQRYHEYEFEIKTGTEGTQRIVRVTPHKQGSSFILVHVQQKSGKYDA